MNVPGLEIEANGQEEVSKLFNSLVDILKTCIPGEDGEEATTRCVIIVDDMKNKKAFITGLNITGDEAKDLIIFSFRGIIGQEIAMAQNGEKK